MALTKVNGNGVGTLSSGLTLTSDDPTITMTDSSGTNDIATLQATSGALIITARDGSSDGEIIFKKTDGSATDETMRIKNDGKVGIGTDNPSRLVEIVGNVASDYVVNILNDGNNANRYVLRLAGGSDSGSGTSYLIGLKDGDSNSVGSITHSGGNASFNTSSDYRLKENVVDMTGAIARVKSLAPKRFNFISNPGTTVDGFLAHEAQTVVPESVIGTHNEIDDDGNAVMQAIDQAKLVPLLTGALQEAIAKIEALEARVTALEDA